MDLPAKTILVVGTYDTKDDELSYLAGVIRAQGGTVLTMDVSVLGNPKTATDITKHQVADAAGSSIEAAIAAADENFAMQIMARGSATLALRLHREGKFDGVIVLAARWALTLRWTFAPPCPWVFRNTSSPPSAFPR